MNTFQKPKRPIDYLPNDPNKAMHEVWNAMDLDFMREKLEYWPEIAMCDYADVYEESDDREQFLIFFNELLIFIEAAYFYYKDNDDERRGRDEEKDEDAKELIDSYNLPKKISDEAARDPLPLVEHFCKMFSLNYTRIELWDLFESVTCYSGEYFAGKGVDRIILNHLYICLSALTEAAYIITGVYH
jgi:hypothetical protein